MQGYLRIFDSKINQWITRYFVLTNSELSYYHNEYRSKELRKYNLDNCLIDKTIQNLKNVKGFLFRIRLENGTQLRLVADRKIEIRKWIKIIQKASVIENSKSNKNINQSNTKQSKNNKLIEKNKKSKYSTELSKFNKDQFWSYIFVERLDLEKIETDIKKEIERERERERVKGKGKEKGKGKGGRKKKKGSKSDNESNSDLGTEDTTEKDSDSNIGSEENSEKDNLESNSANNNDTNNTNANGGGNEGTKENANGNKDGKIQFIMPQQCDSDAKLADSSDYIEILDLELNATALTCFQVFFYQTSFYTSYYNTINAIDLRFENWKKIEKGIYYRKTYSSPEIKGAGPLMSGKKALLTENQKLLWKNNKEFQMSIKCDLKDAPFSDSFHNMYHFDFKENENGKTHVTIGMKILFVKFCIAKKIIKDKTALNQKNAMKVWGELSTTFLNKFIQRNDDIGLNIGQHQFISLNDIENIKVAQSSKRAGSNNKDERGGGGEEKEEEEEEEVQTEEQIIPNVQTKKLNFKIKQIIFFVLLFISMIFFCEMIYRKRINLGVKEIENLKNQTEFLNEQLKLLLMQNKQPFDEKSNFQQFDHLKKSHSMLNDLNFWSKILVDLNKYIIRNQENVEDLNNQIFDSETKAKQLILEFEKYYEQIQLLKKYKQTHLKND